VTGPDDVDGSASGGAGSLRVGYVLGTTEGGTGRHVAMLAGGLLSAGAEVLVLGPEATMSLFSVLGSAAPGSGVASRSGAGSGSRGASRSGAGSGGGLSFAPVAISDRPRPLRDLRNVVRLRRRLRRFAPDVVHAHGVRAGAMTALARRPVSMKRRAGRRGADGGGGSRSTAGARSSDRSGGRSARGDNRVGSRRPALVVTVHNAPPTGTRLAAIYVLLERIVARRADVVLCVSPDLSARMRDLGAQDVQRAVVPAPDRAQDQAAVAGAGSADSRRGLGDELGVSDRPIILGVGRLAPQKAFDVLLRAAATVRWRERRPVPGVVIAGDGPLASELADLARDLGVDARWLGRRDDVPGLIAAADVFVLPSRWEGQPLVLQEALRAGRPIVASDVGGVRDLTGDDAAVLIPPDDPEALAQAVLAVLDDAEVAGRLAMASSARAAKLSTEADATCIALDLYGRLARGDSRSAAVT
jgi:glycosyltransferase involved in cell wall biosynthesis